MSYRNADIIGDVGFGRNFSYDDHEPMVFEQDPDPYLPIENEPMGAYYSPTNFDSSMGQKVYNYNPLTYKTNSTSYFDSWNPLEKFANKNPDPAPKYEKFLQNPWASDQFYIIMFVTFIFILIIIFAYMQHKQSENLQKIIEILMKNDSVHVPKAV